MRLLIPLFSPPTGTWGGLTRVLAIAGAAERAGHVVAFCASGPMAGALEARRLPVYRMPASTLFGLPAAMSGLLARFAQRAAIPGRAGRSVGDLWTVLAVTGFAKVRFLRALVAAELAAASEFRPDALFTDLDPGAPLLARVGRVPLAANYAAIATIGRGSCGWRLMRRAVSRVLASFGLPPATPEDLCFAPSVLKIVPSIPELEDTDPARPDVRFVGPLLGSLLPPNTEGLLPVRGTRYLFAYVGTGSISLDVLRSVLPRFFRENGPIRAVVAAQSIARPYRMGGVEFTTCVDADRWLPHCDWTLCHGGQNTIMQSLRHGVPLLLFPGAVFERRYNARKVQDAGAGVVANNRELTADWLAATLPQRPQYLAAAAVLQARFSAFGGAPAAVSAIESWCVSATGVRR